MSGIDSGAIFMGIFKSLVLFSKVTIGESVLKL